jgi:hypothetical protein
VLAVPIQLFGFQCEPRLRIGNVLGPQGANELDRVDLTTGEEAVFAGAGV